MGENQHQRCGTGTSVKTCTNGVEMQSMRNDWKPRLLNDKLKVDSTSQDEVLRTPDIKEPAANSTSTDEPQKPENPDRNQQSIDGEEEDGSDCDLKQKDGAKSELSKATKVTTSLKSLTDAGNDKEGVVGYDKRMLVVKAGQRSHVNMGAAVARKQEYVDNCESPEEPLKDTTGLKNGAGNATDSNLKELGKEDGTKDVATSTPPRRTQRLRKKTRKASELNVCDL